MLLQPGKKGCWAHGGLTPSSCPRHCSAQIAHRSSPNTFCATGIAQVMGTTSTSLITRNHRCFCLFPLCPVGYFTRKCCWGFLVGKNWLLFWQERKCQAFKTVLKGKTVTTQSAQSTAARRNGLTALELLRHPTAANIPISQQNNQFNCGLSQQRRLKFRQAGSARSQRMRTVNVPSVSGW